MLNNKNNIQLVCLASENNRKAIVNQFEQLGILFDPIDAYSWIKNHNKAHDDPIVLIPPENDIGNDIFKTNLTSTNPNIFIIYFSPLKNEIIPILNASKDCCSWPCDPLEISFRISRFLSKLCNPSSLEKYDIETVVWRDLSLIGKSSIFLEALSFIKNASNCDAPVLLESETGCGKEVTARAIHYLGKRKGFPFIPMNCGAIPDQLLENELFGHEKGAFTDAKQSQAGLTAQADGGTLFLDELEALSPKGQVTLLRFIEDNVIRPLGATKSRKVNVRVIAASNVNLGELVAKGQFRQDLLFRLNLLHLNLPPLRERKDDIQILADHFLEKFRYQYSQPHKRYHPETVAWMQVYHWPGNVRELENFVHKSFLLSQESEIFSPEIYHETKQPYSRRKLFDRRQVFAFDAPFNEAKNNAIEYFEKSYLSWLISDAKGNVTQAAEKAQKERRALGKLLKKHTINSFHYR
jgi:DNA-binding NtrC family response regulator